MLDPWVLAPGALPIEITYPARILASDACRLILAHDHPGCGKLARMKATFPTAFYGLEVRLFGLLQCSPGWLVAGAQYCPYTVPTVALYADACFAFRLGAVVIGEEAQSRHRKRSLLQSIQDTTQ